MNDPKEDFADTAEKLNVEVPPPQLFQGDCMGIMANIPDASVDLILNDPPYGVTSCDWDVVLDLDDMWLYYERILSHNGQVVLFAQAPFTSKLIESSHGRGWKYYTLVFEKYNMTNPFEAKNRPLRYHEDIVVFYREGSKTYNQDDVKYEKKTWGGLTNQGMRKDEKNLRNARSILPVYPLEKIVGLPQEYQGENHSTRKPVKTMEWLLKAYSNYGDVVLDNTMGSGSTGVACVNQKRAFIGIEMDSNFFGLAKKRVELAMRKELIEATEAVERKPVVMPPLRAKFNPKELNEFIKSINPEAYEFEEVVKFACDYLARYFKLVVGRDLKVIEYEYEVFDDGYIIVQHLERSEAGAKARLCKNLIGGKNIFDFFKGSDDYPMYDSMEFDPTAGSMLDFPEDGHLNTFYGHRGEHVTRRVSEIIDSQVIKDHIFNLCGANTDYYEYYLDVLAYPVQTGEKSEVAILQRGPQGCGKGAFYKDFLANKVYGRGLSIEVAGGKQIGGTFNSLLSQRCLIIIDEPGKFNFDRRQALKNSITTDDVEVKAKYEKERVENDYSNFIFTCNDVPDDLMDHDDRRFFCVEHTGIHVGDKEYFKILYDNINDDRVVAGFYQMLMDREIKHYSKGSHPPQTSIKERLIVRAIDPVFRYLRHRLDHGLIPKPVDAGGARNFKASEARKELKSDFYAKCLKFCEQRGFKPSWKGKSGTVFDNIILEKFEKYFPTGFKMIKQAKVGGRTLPCIIFPEPEVLWEWLERSKVLMTEDELDHELEKQHTAEATDWDQALSDAEEEYSNYQEEYRKKLIEMDQLQDDSKE